MIEETITRIEKKVRCLLWMMGVQICLSLVVNPVTLHLLCQILQRLPQTP